MKKTILCIGSILIIAAPVSAISCSNTKNNETIQPKNNTNSLPVPQVNCQPWKYDLSVSPSNYFNERNAAMAKSGFANSGVAGIMYDHAHGF